MSNFLDKAKQNAKDVMNNQKGGNSPLNNPFINKAAQKAPAAVPGVPAAPKVPGVSIPKPPMPPKGGLPKPPVPPMPKPVAPKAPVEAEEPKKEVPVKEAPVAKEPVETKATEVKETVPAETKVEAKTETKNEEVKAEEKKAEPKKKAPAKSKSKAKAKDEKKEEPKEEVKKDDSKEATVETVAPAENVELPKSELTYAEAVTAIQTEYVDKEWTDFEEKTEKRYLSIFIPSNPTKPQINDLLSQINVFRDELIFTYNRTKSLYENLTLKDEGLIDVVKRANAKGSNAEERKTSGLMAIMNYKTPNGEKVNLVELLSQTKIKYNFLKTVIDSLDYKKTVLLTELSSQKNEK